MSYFRKVTEKLNKLTALLKKEDRWLIVINADPDAMASAMALKRILSRFVKNVKIARINDVSRPDNLAMIQYLRIPMIKFDAETMATSYDKFAMVDSQPHHNKAFAGVHYSIILDHHPLVKEYPLDAELIEIRAEYGAVSTLLTEYLYGLDMVPGKLLATALQYGIKTDTSSFERAFNDVDMRAYKYLSKFSNQALLTRITRSEYKESWMPFFVQAASGFHKVSKTGRYVFLGEVHNPDILVVLADFGMRIHEIQWIVVAGVYNGTVVAIYRGDGITRDMGAYAAYQLGNVGSAGGHKSMARAEFPVSVVQDTSVEYFLFKRLSKSPSKTKKIKPESEAIPLKS